MRVPPPARALDPEAAAARLDAVGQAAQAGPAAGRGAADAVVARPDDHERAVCPASRDRRPRMRRAVLDDVRERLAGDEVRRRLDVGGRGAPPAPRRPSTGQRRPDRERLEGGREAVLVRIAGWTPRASSRSSSTAAWSSVDGRVEQRSTSGRILEAAPAAERRSQRERDEPLLRAVVEVALDAAAARRPPPRRSARATRAPRSSCALELRVQSRVLEREARRRTGALEQLRARRAAPDRGRAPRAARRRARAA